MNIVSKNHYSPKDRPWVTRLLRYMGFLITICMTLLGFLNSAALLAPLVEGSLDVNNAAGAVIALAGGLIGFLAGLLASLPLWGFAMLLDDVRAIRIQTEEYLSYDR